MPDRYRRLESGLPQKIWPNKETPQERRERMEEERLERRRQHYLMPRNVRRAPNAIAEGRVERERAPDEIDRGSYEYRIQALVKAVKSLPSSERAYEGDGWC